MQIAGHFLIEDHGFGKAGEFHFFGYFFCQVQHDLFGNVKSPVIQSAIITLHTYMIVSGDEKNDITFCYGVFLIATGQYTLSVLNKSNHIIFMEVVWKWLYDPLKTVCLNPKFIVINHRPCFFLHVCSLLAGYHCSISKCKRLVKYLHFSQLTGLLPLDMAAYELWGERPVPDAMPP